MTIDSAKQKLIVLARAQVGYREGANNQNKYADDSRITKLYGWNVQNQPWCCTFVNWCFLNAFDYDIGSRLTYGGTAACANSMALFRNNGAVFNTPEVGDQVFFYSGGGVNHTGLVIEVSSGAFRAVEGNYSDGVGLTSYPISSPKIAGFGRPNWKLVEGIGEDAGAGKKEEAKADPKPASQASTPYWPPRELKYGMKGPDVSVLQALLKVQDYDCTWIDGDFGPRTKNMLMAFQAEHGLESDGVLHEATYKALAYLPSKEAST